jgi:signal transduction histidine kinase
VRLQVDPCPDFIFEVSLIEIILDQVIENSIHFAKSTVSEKWMEINSVVNKETDTMEIEIKDNGIGIDPKFIPEVTDPFFKGTILSTGNGLGLYIVKRVCELIQGKIEVSSDGVTGTTVKVTLPNLKSEGSNTVVNEVSALRA